MYELATELYALPRSLTGDGVRQTLGILQRHVPLELHEVPSGTQVFDWTVPREWNVRDAHVRNSRGEKVIDFRVSPLHLVGYSVPVRRRMRLAELRPHLFTLPEHPDWIPYRTAYYADTWGFCLSHRSLAGLEDGEYDVEIDASLEDGHLTYGEYLVPGRTADEVLFSCHCCHPAMANDNVSGMVLAALLAEQLAGTSPQYSYRFLFVPGTIGSITWLALNEDRIGHIKHGLVVACVGDGGPFTYKRSRRGDADIDRVVANVLRHSGRPHRIVDFSPYGYDERQYCSPAFDLPVGCLSRTPHGQFSQYHTSADDLDFIRAEHLEESLELYRRVLSALEHDATYVNLSPKGEPRLGKRGLYRSIGGQAAQGPPELPMLWVLNLSDGRHSLLDISDRSGLDFETIRLAADALHRTGLLGPPRRAW
jgi:aminopeptidase-like protein